MYDGNNDEYSGCSGGGDNEDKCIDCKALPYFVGPHCYDVHLGMYSASGFTPQYSYFEYSSDRNCRSTHCGAGCTFHDSYRLLLYGRSSSQ